MPILRQLEVDNYDKIDLGGIKLKMKEAMKEFKRKWKTLDEDRIMYLLKYGIVQEVMKIE